MPQVYNVQLSKLSKIVYIKLVKLHKNVQKFVEILPILKRPLFRCSKHISKVLLIWTVKFSFLGGKKSVFYFLQMPSDKKSENFSRPWKKEEESGYV